MCTFTLFLRSMLKTLCPYVLKEKKIFSDSINSNRSTSSSSSADESYRVFPPDHELDLSDGEESVIMLPHLRHRHLEASLSANAVNADVGSICSQTTRRITLR